MKALSGSYSKFSASYQREKARCSSEIALSRREIAFRVRQKRVRDGISLAVSFQLKRVRSISAVSSSAQTDVDSEEIQINSSDKAKTVRVRIKLLKECTFGEQFLVVGDDPILGSWNPTEGVPLDWSEGHVWAAEMDIPIGKVIKYKFIHRGFNGAILWQPGTDRVLQTWETEKIISVSEDWDNPDLQNIVEDDFVDVASLINSDLGQTLVEEEENVVGKVENIASEEMLSSSDKETVIVSEETSGLSSLEDETGLVLDEGVPVLVPGLVPASLGENEAEEENMMIESDEIKDSAESHDEIKDSAESGITESDDGIKDSAESEQQNDEETTTEVNGVCVPTASSNSIETSETVVDEKQQYGEERVESNVLGSDMQWGRRTLQKFLANLGFI